VATIDDVNSTLQNIARQMGNQAQSQLNATPSATASTSPVSYPFNNIGTSTATAVISANANRYGLIFHNPGATASIYVYPSAMTVAPTTSTLGGTFVIYPGSTLSFPSPLFANANGAWSAFSGTGSNQPFTVVEFI
jgi:hypothetical protein